MNAYDLSNTLKEFWMRYTDKNSGNIDKKTEEIQVTVLGKDVIGVKYKAHDNSIELIVEEDNAD